MNFYGICLIISSMAIALSMANDGYQSGGGSVNSIGNVGRQNQQQPRIGNQQQQGVFIPILRDDRTQTGQGEYNFAYETANGIQRQEAGTQNDGQITQGGWSYTSPEGIPIQLTFISDQGGYQPQGAHLPVAPALPYQREQQFIHRR